MKFHRVSSRSLWGDLGTMGPHKRKARRIRGNRRPENYILARPHSPSIAEQLGDLWEVILPEDAEVEGVKIGRGVWEYRVNLSTWQGSHLFRAKGKRHVIATAEARSWLENRAKEWLGFQETQVF
jgi:hypothetical protein